MSKTKSIKSQDGKLEVKYDEVTHVCIAPNLYPLLQYLLLMDDDVVFHHTCYFVDEVIPKKVREQIPCVFYEYFGNKIQRKLLKFRICYFKYKDFPFLKTAELYAYDLPYFNLLIGDRGYNLLADAPFWLTLNMQEHSEQYIRQQKQAKSLFGKIQKIFFGNVFLNYWGNNSQCKAVFLTEENTSPVLIGKKIHIQSFSSLWDIASERKKQFIMGLFGITNEDVLLINSRPILFFSQPLIKDCGLTEMEYVDILTTIFQNYSKNSIIVKTHPRDNFDYAKYFSDVIVFTKSVNSQFLYLIGVSPQKIITINSTAIEGFPESIECDYYGSHIHPKLEQYYGMGYKPDRIVNFK